MKLKGFTLIELLVVIAIIGILASIVLVSLTVTRSQSNDTKIKAELGALSIDAQNAYDLNVAFDDNYSPSGCGTAQMFAITKAAGNPVKLALIAEVVSIITAAGNASGGLGGLNQATCVAVLATQKWAVSVPLRTAPGNSWCIDSSGVSKQITGSVGGTATC